MAEIKRGGSHTARARGDRGIVVHVCPDAYAALARAAEQLGLTLKDHCRRTLLCAHGIADDRVPQKRRRSG